MRCSVSPPESVHEIAIANNTNTILMKTTMMILDSTMTILMMMMIMKKRITQSTSDVHQTKYFVSRLAPAQNLVTNQLGIIFLKRKARTQGVKMVRHFVWQPENVLEIVLER